MRYLICFGSDLFLHLLERHCFGYDFQISVCKNLGSPSNKKFPVKTEKKTIEATDLQETTQLGARSLKSSEGCFLKWWYWYPQQTPKMIIFSRKTHVLGNPQTSAENLQTCFLGSLHHIIALSGYREGLLHTILYQGNESP